MRRLRETEDEAYERVRQRELDRDMIQEIDFNEERHEYRIDGHVVPSVTQVLDVVRKEGGSESQREYKRQIGKALDTAIELHEKDDLDPDSLDEAVVPFFEAWLKFKAETGFRVLLNQLLVYSKKLRCAGTLDLLGTRDPALMAPDELLDTKCVWTMDAATALQTAGYALLSHESHGIRVKKRGGVQLLRDGTYKFYPYSNPNDEHVFKACLSINAWKGLHQ